MTGHEIELRRTIEATRKGTGMIAGWRTVTITLPTAEFAADSIQYRQKYSEMRETLQSIAPALSVLETMCKAAGLKAGAAKAKEMKEWCNEVL